MPTYDPSQVVITVDGAALSGLAAGTFVTVSRSTDTFTTVVGADGEVTRVKSADRSGTLSVVLTQSSNSNAVLAALAARDELTSNAVFPIQVKDNSGTSIFFSSEAWIKKPPDGSFGDTLGTREWTFGLARVEMNHGGN
jgi:hypothetical protein